MGLHETNAVTFTRIESGVLEAALYDYHEDLLDRLSQAETGVDPDPFELADLRAQLEAFATAERKVKQATQPARTQIPKSWNRSVT